MVLISNIKSQPLFELSKNWLFVEFFSTVERGPTLSAEHIDPGKENPLLGSFRYTLRWVGPHPLRRSGLSPSTEQVSVLPSEISYLPK